MEHDIKTLTSRLATPGQDIDCVRLDIANLMTKGLSEIRNTLGYWEKAHYRLAIQNLRKNMWLLNRESTTYLGACLLCIENAHIPVHYRSRTFLTKDIQIDALSWQDLMTRINNARKEAGSQG